MVESRMEEVREPGSQPSSRCDLKRWQGGRGGRGGGGVVSM